MNNQVIYANHIKKLSNVIFRISSAVYLKPVEFLILLVPPLIIILGQLIHIFSVQEEINNFFTDKKNFINQIFVKKGWFWTILVYLIICFEKFISNKNDLKPILKSIGRILILTLWWVFFTQWFFGLPIMDKVFLNTGGECSNIPGYNILGKKGNIDSNIFMKIEQRLFAKNDKLNEEQDFYRTNVLGSKSCRYYGGQWSGGHDPSGHIFLLVLGSILLAFEYLLLFSQKKTLQKMKHHLTIGKISTITLISLWLWMLLMTSVYFHSFVEKLFGLVWCYSIIGVVYCLFRKFKILN
ncbi:hypothetical protein PACTADRAFT_76976 [Pachysolen tannophilus NRRL Y-2460]|uniref:Uncharacterized protein n=1 Tax=Pachysolen tannophilus NRRL Y-2460 TaxID=669874 RepID=A0A1E4TRI1_PACTA|nr:hypothetical protein PACTADRAFT_76976 [Pachysolen tannophilus NRRL Y-2460]